jgi:6-phosphogluconolactonase (cycloisomerase 2 family)
MNVSVKSLSAMLMFGGWISLGTPGAFPAAQAAVAHYVVTNDDNSLANTATFYSIAAGGKLLRKAVIKTGGTGIGTGYFASARVNVLHNKTQSCVYVSNAGSSDVAAIDEGTLKRIGTFKASTKDDGHLSGIGMAANQHYLYAAFTSSNTIATYRILSVCKLQFLKDVIAVGLGGGAPTGMAIHANLLVVAYGDGSIQSFSIAKGAPVSNHDEQNSTGYNTNLRPTAVDISKDGNYAIFGDVPVKAKYTTIEVSDISKGKLQPTVVYGGYDGSLGMGVNSSNVELSPDETLIYVSNNQGGTVTAVFFDKSTGVVSRGCVSSVLNGFNATWFYGGAVGLKNNASGTGGVVYLAESGNGGASSIGIVTVKSNGTTCSLTESKSSPAQDANSPGLLSIGSYPPRSF